MGVEVEELGAGALTRCTARRVESQRGRGRGVFGGICGGKKGRFG